MARILIIDDEALNRELLHAFLEDSGHTLVDADSGERALELARVERADLVLCDVLMPKLNGFEVTRQLKEQSRDEFLPIILLTSLSDPSARLLGLRAGADDFLVKPIDRLELAARVSNLLSLRQKELSLARRNIELLELHRRRDEMAAMIVHDLKNPMSVILANLAYLSGEQQSERLGTDEKEALHDAVNAGRRMQRMLANLLDLARLEASRFELRRQQTSLTAVLGTLVSQRGFMIRSRDIQLSVQLDGELCIDADVDLLTRAFENLLDHAIRYTPAGGRAEVRGAQVGSRVSLWFADTGPVVPPAARAVMFEKYGHGDGLGRASAGLGLYFCKLVVEAHGGTIEALDEPGFATTMHLSLPVEGRRALEV